MNRREFIETSAGAMGAAMLPLSESPRVQAATRPIGIQVGAVSFLDEGTDRVLDILSETAAVDTLFLAAFTYGRGIGGRQPRGSALPDHGKQEYDDNYHGGIFATPHPQVLQEHVDSSAEGARSSGLRRHRRCPSARTEARHEGDRLVRGRLPQRRSGHRQSLRGGRARQAGRPRLLPQPEHDELLARAHRGLPPLLSSGRTHVRQRAAGAL